MARAKNQIILSGNVPDWKRISPENATKNRSFERMLWEAQNYVHYEISVQSTAKSFIKYLQKIEFDSEKVKLISKLPDYYFETLGKWTYISLKGVKLPENYLQSILDGANELYDIALSKHSIDEQPKKDMSKDNVISIQDRMRIQLQDLFGEFESAVDQLISGKITSKDYDAYSKIKSYEPEVKAAHAKIVRDVYEQSLDEAHAIAEFKDEEIREAYAHLPARQRKDLVKFYEGIITACDTVINTNKAIRKPRAKKTLSKDKIVAKLNYKKNEPDLGLASINPATIVGATQLWVYNTKTRKLGVFYADKMIKELSVKGTTIVGFDPETSTQKTVRKPDEVLKGANKLARTKIAKLYKELTTTETKINGRINEHSILLRVF